MSSTTHTTARGTIEKGDNKQRERSWSHSYDSSRTSLLLSCQLAASSLVGLLVQFALNRRIHDPSLSDSKKRGVLCAAVAKESQTYVRKRQEMEGSSAELNAILLPSNRRASVSPSHQLH